jgi:hypothetical protein
MASLPPFLAAVPGPALYQFDQPIREEDVFGALVRF